MAHLVKSLPAMQQTRVRSVGREGPLEKEKAATPAFWPGDSMDCRVHGVTESRTRLRKRKERGNTEREETGNERRKTKGISRGIRNGTCKPYEY